MQTMTKVLAVALASAALAGCTGKKEPAAPSPAPVADADALAPGVWESAISGEGMPAMTVRTCVDASHAKPMVGAGSCSDVTRTKTADGVWTIRATCGAAPNGPITMSGEMRGDLKSAYSISITANAPAGVAGKAAQSVSLKVDAKKTADTCPPSLPPGAIETPQGTIDSSAMKKTP